MAPGTATCEGGLDSLELRVHSLRGALLPGSRGLDASLVGAEGLWACGERGTVWYLATASFQVPSELEWEKSGRQERQT